MYERGPHIRPGVSLVGQVVPRVDGRGVAPELPGEGSRVTVKSPGDPPEGFSLALVDSNEVALMNGQMFVGFSFHPRILTRKTSGPSSVALRY